MVGGEREGKGGAIHSHLFWKGEGGRAHKEVYSHIILTRGKRKASSEKGLEGNSFTSFAGRGGGDERFLENPLRKEKRGGENGR